MKTSEITIEPIALKYAKSFWDALDSVSRERRFLAFLEAPPFERSEAFIKDNVEKKHSQFVAVMDGVVVGWCDILPMTLDGFRHTGHLGMGVKAAFRGCGIGRKLITATIADAFSRGLSRIELEVFSSNTGAVSLYEKLSFVHEGRKRKARYVDGIWDDILIMALLKE